MIGEQTIITELVTDLSGKDFTICGKDFSKDEFFNLLDSYIISLTLHPERSLNEIFKDGSFLGTIKTLKVIYSMTLKEVYLDYVNLLNEQFKNSNINF